MCHSTLRLLGGPPFGILPLGELFQTEKWPYGCEGIRSCRAVTNVSGAVPRVVETVETNKYQQKNFPSHQHAAHPDTRTPVRIPTRMPGLVVSNFQPSK